MTTIQHNENDSRGIFYIQENDKKIAELTYSLNDGVMTIDHTEVNRDQEGKGIGTKLVTKSYEFAKANGRKIDPLCPFAEVLFDQNESWSDVRI